MQSFNKITGKVNFSINIHNNKNFWGGVPWGGMALDEKNEIIYTVLGNPRPGTYGVKRVGPNKNSSSVVALDLKSKKILWTFQETIHDLWDLDIAFPPILITLKINNKKYDCIILSTKIGLTNLPPFINEQYAVVNFSNVVSAEPKEIDNKFSGLL